MSDDAVNKMREAGERAVERARRSERQSILARLENPDAALREAINRAVREQTNIALKAWDIGYIACRAIAATLDMDNSDGLAKDVALWNQAIENARRTIFELLLAHYEGWKRNSGADDSGSMAIGNVLYLEFPEYRDEVRERASDIEGVCNASGESIANSDQDLAT